ncbi:hypothetical protein VTJ04DRAFT_2800 [Mycothermus thermophilus]|uniref:uncharacterized protein n=1 Tax=Humicola insolens TaxID=85995 RepID=UPI003742113C
MDKRTGNRGGETLSRADPPPGSRATRRTSNGEPECVTEQESALGQVLLGGGRWGSPPAHGPHNGVSQWETAGAAAKFLGKRQLFHVAAANS